MTAVIPGLPSQNIRCDQTTATGFRNASQRLMLMVVNFKIKKKSNAVINYSHSRHTNRISAYDCVASPEARISA